jgi:hypothetical protein
MKTYVGVEGGSTASGHGTRWRWLASRSGRLRTGKGAPTHCLLLSILVKYESSFTDHGLKKQSLDVKIYY